MNARNGLISLMVAAVVLAAALAGCATAPREPLALAPVAETFPAPYDVVWDATLRSLGVLRLRLAQKGVGLIETEPFPFTFVVGSAPAPPGGLLHLASHETSRFVLAQGGTGGTRPTQVVWIAMLITVSRTGLDTTHVQVEPRLHDSLLPGFTPGPTNSPWGDLFAKIRSQLGSRPLSS